MLPIQSSGQELLYYAATAVFYRANIENVSLGVLSGKRTAIFKAVSEGNAALKP